MYNYRKHSKHENAPFLLDNLSDHDLIKVSDYVKQSILQNYGTLDLNKIQMIKNAAAANAANAAIVANAAANQEKKLMLPSIE